MQPIILASSSPRRQELIKRLGVPFEIIPANVNEEVSEQLSPVEVVEALARRKAEAVAEQTDGLIIGSDTVVAHGGKVLGKPKNEAHALEMLCRLQGGTHEVLSGIAIIDTTDGHVEVAHRKTEVKMKPVDDAKLSRYIETGEPMDKAGAYGIQGVGGLFVEKIDGDYYTVVGLPLSLLDDMLGRFDVRVLG